MLSANWKCWRVGLEKNGEHAEHSGGILVESETDLHPGFNQEQGVT